jgi:hypothetical protein
MGPPKLFPAPSGPAPIIGKNAIRAVRTRQLCAPCLLSGSPDSLSLLGDPDTLRRIFLLEWPKAPWLATAQFNREGNLKCLTVYLRAWVSLPHCVQLFVNAFDFFGAMKALQSADDEMALAHILEMINEQGVDYGAAKSSHNRHSLCRRFL